VPPCCAVNVPMIASEATKATSAATVTTATAVPDRFQRLL
jgi:hypothetical protein